MQNEKLAMPAGPPREIFITRVEVYRLNESVCTLSVPM